MPCSASSADHPGQTIRGPFSRADPIKAIVAAAAEVPINLMQRLVISPCSISAILFHGRRSGGAVRELHGLWTSLCRASRRIGPMSERRLRQRNDHCTVRVAIGEVGQRLFLLLPPGLADNGQGREATGVGRVWPHIVRNCGSPGCFPRRPRVLRRRGVRVGGRTMASPTTRRAETVEVEELDLTRRSFQDQSPTAALAFHCGSPVGGGRSPSAPAPLVAASLPCLTALRPARPLPPHQPLAARRLHVVQPLAGRCSPG